MYKLSEIVSVVTSLFYCCHRSDTSISVTCSAGGAGTLIEKVVSSRSLSLSHCCVVSTVCQYCQQIKNHIFCGVEAVVLKSQAVTWQLVFKRNSVCNIHNYVCTPMYMGANNLKNNCRLRYRCWTSGDKTIVASQNYELINTIFE